MTHSCLVAKLSSYAPLTGSDTTLLMRLEENEEELRKDQVLRRTGQPVERLYVVKSGWLTSFSILDDGRRQLLKLFYPGDVVDLSEAPLERAHHDIKCLTPVTLCPFPKAGLEPLFRESPRLTAIMFFIATAEASTLLDRIRAIGRFSAYERICYLLLEISDRLRRNAPAAEEGFRVPLTQSDMADLLGLTNVYISKTMAKIEADGLIWREGSRFVIRDRARMQDLCEFRAHGPFDLTWIPDR